MKKDKERWRVTRFFYDSRNLEVTTEIEERAKNITKPTVSELAEVVVPAGGSEPAEVNVPVEVNVPARGSGPASNTRQSSLSSRGGRDPQ